MEKNSTYSTPSPRTKRVTSSTRDYRTPADHADLWTSITKATRSLKRVGMTTREILMMMVSGHPRERLVSEGREGSLMKTRTKMMVAT